MRRSQTGRSYKDDKEMTPTEIAADLREAARIVAERDWMPHYDAR